MGRTIPSFRIALEMEKEEWKPFRNALDKSDRKKFDEMWDIPRLYVSACSNSCQSACTSSFPKTLNRKREHHMLYMTTSETTTRQEVSSETIPKWHMKADYVEVCNCDYGCPCNFSGFPTYGFCSSLLLFSIKEGNYGADTKLDGIDVIGALSWPKAIHEGNGTAQLYISKHANEDQRNAVINIFSGKSKGEGPFAIFAPTFKYILEPQYVDIQKTIDGKKSSFSVPGVMDVQVEPFKNPVTGEEQETEVHLPKGFIWKVGQAVKSKLMRMSTPQFNYDHSGQNAYVSTVEYNGP